ncbi:hypothetical protein [Pseudonocardia lacus]|uniref:hypothetical protein n=1 Tax=Pseudonocardia lacus TaxID=2835865 RepID=UPI001BDD47E7|nr:hypothetical protein [Pseudonocardia lacus]
MTDQPETLTYRDAHGRLHSADFQFGEIVPSPGAALPLRRVVDDRGRHLVCKHVPRDLGERNSGFYDVLDREVRALTRLAQRFGLHYPRELSEVVGYNVDVEEPFVLLREYRGQPAEDAYPSFDDDQRRRFQIGVLRALQHTAYVNVVHGAMSMDSLRWDGITVQLVDFESAGRTRELRRREGTFPRRAPEQAAGTGVQHPGDDMWGVGMVFRQLRLGPFLGDGFPDPGPERMRAELAGLFAETAEQRPTAEQMLLRIRATSSMIPDVDPDEQLKPGRQAFEIASARKRGDVEPGAPSIATAVAGSDHSNHRDAATSADPRTVPSPMIGERSPVLRYAIASVVVLTVVLVVFFLVTQ